MDADKLPDDPTLVAIIKAGEELKSRVFVLWDNWPTDKRKRDGFLGLEETSLAH